MDGVPGPEIHPITHMGQACGSAKKMGVIVMTMKLYAPRGTDLSPLREFATLGNRLGSLFDDRVNGGGTRWAPPVNVEDTAEAMVLTAEVPGLTLDDLSVELENNLLTISGEKREQLEQLEEGAEGRRFHVGERRCLGIPG